MLDIILVNFGANASGRARKDAIATHLLSTMSQPSTLSLPVIDLSSWLDRPNHTEEERRQVSQKLHDACLHYGFFYLKLDGFATEQEMEELANLGRAFFHLDQSEKDEIRLANEDGARGQTSQVLWPH